MAPIRISATDPLNLVGIILPGHRVPAIPSNAILFQRGRVIQTELGRDAPPFDLSARKSLSQQSQV